MNETSESTTGQDSPVLESAAFPPFVRILTVVILVNVIGMGLWNLNTILDAEWTIASGGLYIVALGSVLWMGFWIVNSKTRLDGDVLTQTWLWDKHARAQDVTQLKLVHIPAFQSFMAPRMLVRRSNAAVAWFHSADPRLLTTFAERVAYKKLPGPQGTTPPTP